MVLSLKMLFLFFLGERKKQQRIGTDSKTLPLGSFETMLGNVPSVQRRQLRALFGGSSDATSKASFPLHNTETRQHQRNLSASPKPHPCLVPQIMQVRISFRSRSDLVLISFWMLIIAWTIFILSRLASPKPHPCNMPQAKTEVALKFLECCAAEVALQHSLFCSADVILTKSCAAASEKLQCNIEKAALQESGAFLPLCCGFQAPTFRHPHLGPAEFKCYIRCRFELLLLPFRWC